MSLAVVVVECISLAKGKHGICSKILYTLIASMPRSLSCSAMRGLRFSSKYRRMPASNSCLFHAQRQLTLVINCCIHS
jgi:hypothetical protein